MTNLSQLILDISSDEEASFGDIRKEENKCSELGERDDHNWLTKLLGEVDKKEGCEVNDVVLVKEAISDTVKKSNLQVSYTLGEVISKPLCEIIDINSDSDDDGDDDDCVVLDGDPDKPVLLLGNGDDGSKGGSDSDDVEVVSEKGEVACRDFPHSRHLCAKFIFSSTLHQNHCSQCHCYVCDSLAPCLNWGTGMSHTDHCHASDKEEFWRTERKRKKTGDDKSMPVTIKSLIKQRRLLTQAAPQRPIPLLPSQNLRPATMRPCSMSTNGVVPGVVSPPAGFALRPITPRSFNGTAPRVVNPPTGIPRHITSNATAPRVVNPRSGMAQRHITPMSSNVTAPYVVNARTGIAQGHITPGSSNVTMPRVVNPSTGIAQGNITPRSSSVAMLRVVNPPTDFTQGHVTPRSSSLTASSAVNPSQGHITPGSPNVTMPHVVNPSTGITQVHVTPTPSNVTVTSAVNCTAIARGHITPGPSNGVSRVVKPSVGIAQGHVTSSSSNAITPSVSNPSTGTAQGNTIPGYKRKLQTLSPLHANSMGENFNIEKTSQQLFSTPAAWPGNRNGLCQSQSSREPYLKRCRTLPTSLSNGSYVSNQQTSVSRGLAKSSPPPIRPQLNPEPIPAHPIRTTSGPQIPSQQYVSGTVGNGLRSQSSMGTSDNVIDYRPYYTVQSNSSLPFKTAVSNQPTCTLPSETDLSYQINIDNNTLASQQQPSTIASSYPSMCNTFENQSSQSHVYNNSSSLSTDDKNGFLQDIEKDFVSDTVNFDMDLEAFLGEHNVQASVDTSPADNNQFLSVPIGAHDQNSASKDNFPQQRVVAPDSSLLSGVTDCFQFERPMLENRSLSDAFAASVSSPLWDEFSPNSF